MLRRRGNDRESEGPRAGVRSGRWFGLLPVFFLLLGETAVIEALDPRKTPTQYVHDVWTTEEGLAQNSVNDIIQSRDGYLWLATFGGLVRFNGVEFTVFDSGASPGLASNRLMALAEAPDGTIWIGTEDGRISRMRSGILSTLPRNPDIHTVWDLVARSSESGEDDLWIIDQRGVLRYRGETVERVLKIEGGRALFAQDDGRVWAGTSESLAQWTGEQWILHELPESYGEIQSIAEDGRGGLWLGSAQRLLHFDGERVTPWLERLSDRRRGISGPLTVDRDGVLWTTLGRSLYRLQPEDLASPQAADLGAEAFPISDGFVDILVRSLLEDREGNLWIGSSGGGLHRLRTGEFTTYSQHEGFPTASPRALAEYGGEIVVGTICQGVFLFQEDKGFKAFEGPDGPLGCIGSLFVEGSDLWVGADDLYRYRRGEGWLEVPEAAALQGAQTNTIFRDRSGFLWVGTEQGLFQFGPGPDPSVRKYRKSDGLVDDHVTFLMEDRHGVLWIGTRGGLGRLRDGVFDNLSATEGLPDPHVRAIHEDSEGMIWIGMYGGGLWLLQDVDGMERRARFTTSNGLPENIVSRILELDGEFWMSGNRGVTRVRRAALIAYARGELDAYEAVLFSRVNGLHPSETNGGTQPAGLHASDDRLWFPVLRGIAVVEPRRARASEPPPIVIEEVRVDDRIVASRAAEMMRTIRVPPGSERLEITYAGLRLAAPDEVRYSYRLAGLQDFWSSPDSRRTAYFSRLPPGSYSFEVTARAQSGAEPGAAARAMLVLEPFWWQTDLFRLFLFSLFALLLVGGVSWRLRRSRRRANRLEKANRALEAEVERRRRAEKEHGQMLSELEQKVVELGQVNSTISHDLKNPLLTIRTFLGKLEHDLPGEPSEQVLHDLARIDTAATEMSALLDDLIELGRVGQSLQARQTIDLDVLVREALKNLGEAVEGVDVMLEDLPQIVGDRARLREVFQHLLANAARFMGDQSRPRVIVGCREKGTKTILFVRDNGIGVEPAYHEKVFELFERLDHSRTGTGIGLAIVRRIVEMHEGRIWVESAGRGTGSTFCLMLPQPESAATER